MPRTTNIWKSLLTFLVSLFVCGVTVVAVANGPAEIQLTSQTRKLLIKAIGDADPAVPHRLAERLGPRQLAAAFYSGSRVERLIALDAAAANREDPFYLIPSLAALMGAEDRQVASSAAHALDEIIRRRQGMSDGFEVLVPGQVLQIVSQLTVLAEDPRLDTDIRIIAMSVIAALEPLAEPSDRHLLVELLDDREVAVRRQAVGLLVLPFDDATVARLAKATTDDDDYIMRGEAATMLCENALAHDVKDPSVDLTAYLKAILQTPGMPVGVMGGILACLSQFDGENKKALIDVAVAHPDPAVKAFWKSLQ